jgi:hypothetical protein
VDGRFGTGVGESAEEIYRRAQAAAGPDGRLAMPPVHEWETFPFEGEIRVRGLEPPVGEEQPRHGERGGDCIRCLRGDESAIWSNDGWRVVPLHKAGGLPVVVILESRDHLDLPDLSDELAAELGQLIVRVERAVRSVGGVGRVHVAAGVTGASTSTSGSWPARRGCRS